MQKPSTHLSQRNRLGSSQSRETAQPPCRNIQAARCLPLFVIYPATCVPGSARSWEWSSPRLTAVMRFYPTSARHRTQPAEGHWQPRRSSLHRAGGNRLNFTASFDVPPGDIVVGCCTARGDTDNPVHDSTARLQLHGQEHPLVGRKQTPNWAAKSYFICKTAKIVVDQLASTPASYHLAQRSLFK